MKSIQLFLNLSLLLLAASCTPIKNSRYSEYLNSKSEIAACETTYTYSTTTTLTGIAQFYKRGVNLVIQSSQLKNLTQGDPLQTALPIKYAEVIVYNSKNEIVQCGRTNSTGLLKAVNGTDNLTIPATSDTFTVRVFSRAKKVLTYTGKPDFDLNVAVKQNPYTDELYHLSTSFSSNGIDDSGVLLTAYARQTESLEVDGGAFNILNSITSGYEYVQNNTGTVDTTCLNNKLNVYWKLGFNPAQYSSPEISPENLASNSYYDHISSNLYITGGSLGNFTLVPAHHFDDYVVIHELGHHIENACGSLLSPGGTHYLINRIDPRLAWAEGWANYFAAQVMRSSLSNINPEFSDKMSDAGFSDTTWKYFYAAVGFSDSIQNIGNASGFMFDLTKAGKNPDTWQYGLVYGRAFDQVDPSKYKGEGHFREAAITRGLFKVSNACGTNCATTPVSFENMWKSMNNLTGVGQDIYPFKSSARYLEILKSLVGVATWNAQNYDTTIASGTAAEALHLFTTSGTFTSGGINRWITYGTYLENTSSSACTSGTFYIEPRSDDPVLTATNSDQRYSNHYYTIDFSKLPNLTELNVTFTKVTPTGTDTEFDLILFQENYFFNGDYSCTVELDAQGECSGSYVPSRSTNSDVVKSDRRTGLSLNVKTLRDLNLLDQSKKYLLNIRAYTPNKTINSTTDYSYIIKDQSGNYICP